MGLFAREPGAEEVYPQGARQRMTWIRERGTRKLLITVILAIGAWFGFAAIQDRYLLSSVWPVLQAEEKGLTVVGTLDSRSAYDRNLFKIISANKTTRVELTDFGWRSIFSGTEGPLFSDGVGNAIQQALLVDGQNGFTLLEPYIRVAVARELRLPNANALVSEDLPVRQVEKQGNQLVEKSTTFGALLKKFTSGDNSKEKADTVDRSEGGSASNRDVEHGVTIPGLPLARACPVVLTGKHFTGAELEEKAASLLLDKTYTVNLHLTKEGRSRFYQWSRDHAQESLVFIVNGEVLTAGRISQTLDVNSWEINNIRDEETARLLADFVNKNRAR